MNVEQILTDELRDVGAAVLPPPPPDPAQLVRQAEQARVRTLIRSGASVVLAAAAVLGIILLGTHLGDPKAAPPPAPKPTGLQTGAPPAIPYQLGNQVYADGVAVAGGTVNTTAMAGHYRVFELRNGADLTLVVFRDGTEVKRLEHAHSAVSLSPDGTKLAYLEVVGSDDTLVLRDLDADRELGRIALDPSTFGRPGESVEGVLTINLVDDDGTVHYTDARPRAWKPGSSPVNEADEPQIPGRVPGLPADALYPEMSPDLTWAAWLAPEDDGPTLDDGAPAAYLRAQQPHRPDTLVSVALPEGSDARGVTWETETDLLVHVYDNANGTAWHYLRCSITSKRCEFAPVTGGTDR